MRDTELAVSPPCAAVTKSPSTLDCTRSMASGSGEVTLPLCSAQGRHIGVQGWDPPGQERLGQAGVSPAKAAEMAKGLEHRRCEGGLGELELLSLERRGLGRGSCPWV